MTSLGTHLTGVNLGRRWRSLLGVTVLLGMTMGLSLFSLAGARRTQSSYPRFLRSAHAPTMSVSPPGGYDATNAAIAAFPEVVRSRTYVGFQVYVLAHDQPDFAQDFEASGTFDGRFFDQDRFTATRGRRPDPAVADEVAVNELTAERLGYHVGQHLDLATYSMEQFSDPSFFRAPPPPKMRTSATIVGIGVFPDEILQDQADHTTRLLLTPAFSASARAYATYSFQGLELRNGDADVDAVRRRLTTLYPSGTTDIRVTSVDRFHALRATRPISLALGAFGAVSAAAAIVLACQALAGLVRLQADEAEVLRSLGAGPRSILWSGVAGPALAVVAGTALAGLAAIVASPLMPIGPVSRIEGHGGYDLDATVVGFGSLAIVVVLLGFTTGAAWRWLPHRPVRRRSAPAGRPTLASAAASLGMPPTAVTGLRIALEPGPGASAVSARAVIAGAAVSITALVSAITFGASLGTLVHQPPLYGWNWSVAVLAGNGYDKMPLDKVHSVLDADEHVESWSGAYFGTDTIDGSDTPLLGMAPGSNVLPPLTSGRAVERASEIVLGAATAARLHKTVDDTVTLNGGGSHTVKVVGIATLPTIGIVHAAHTSLGSGALVVPELVPGYDRDITGVPAAGLGPSVVFIRYRPGTDANAELAHLRETTQPLAGFAGLDVLPVQRPAEIASSTSIGKAPVLLAVALGLGAMASLNLALGTSVRRRRRDLALLKALGFTRGQLAATVCWQATMTVGIGLLFGVPGGLAIGRTLWRLFADQLNVVAKPTVPLTGLIGAVLASVALANAVAAIPARATRRVNPAALLRSI